MAGTLICLATNLALCLGISGNLADPEYDPLAPLALQLKLVRIAPADNVRWALPPPGALCLAADAEARCAFGSERDVELVARPGAGWEWDGAKLRLRDSALCLSAMECWRRAVPGSANRTYCDSRVSFLNEMSAAQLAGAAQRVRGSYVKLAKCAADLPSQRFVVVASSAPSASPYVLSHAPSSLPSLSPSLLPSASPSFRPSASPSISSYSGPSASPSASRATTSSPHAPPSTVAPTALPHTNAPTASPRSTQPTSAPNAASAEQWWPAVLAVGLLVAAGAGFAAFRRWGGEKEPQPV